MVVDADHPRRHGEQSGVTGCPTGVFGARHRVTADETLLQTGRGDRLKNRAFDTRDVGASTWGPIR